MLHEGLTEILPSPWRPSVMVSLCSYGHANGPIVHEDCPARHQRSLAYNIRHLPNPPRHLRASATGLSRRLQKEFLRNDDVEAFLEKVQNEVLDAVNTECDNVMPRNEPTEAKDGEVDGSSDKDPHHLSEAASHNDLDVEVVVTVCCEEGRHRSVAFIEELARRLMFFKNGRGLYRYWQLSVNIIHRDIGDSQDLEQSSAREKRSNKAKAESRHRARGEKGDRLRSVFSPDGHDESLTF